MMRILSIAILLSVYGAQASTSGQLLMKGTVPQLFNLTVLPDALSTALPLSTTQNRTRVARLKASANTNNGYRISVSSANGGKLVHATSLSSNVPYTLRVGGRETNLVTGQTHVFNRNSPVVNRNHGVRISYTGIPHEDLLEGDYSDVLTFSISVN